MSNLIHPRRTVLPPILNKVLLRAAIFQVLITIGFEVVLVLGALSAQSLSGSDRIFGLATTTIFAIGQLVIALPVGKWMDRYGRRPILLLGSLVETASLIMIGAALLVESQFLFSLSLILLGLGSGAAQMAYLIGGDIYPSNRRAEGLSLMTTSISIGIVGGPYLIGLIGDLATTLNLDPLIVPWFCLSILTVIASWLMYGLSPEPLTVASDPQPYYASDENAVEVPAEDESTGTKSLGDLLRQYPIVASVGIMFCFQGVRLSIVPLLTYVLQARSYSLSLSSLMVAAMGIGMVLASSLIGRMGDKWGRRKTLLLAIVVGGIGAGFLPIVLSLVVMFLLLLVLGVAFSTSLTMTRVIITDVTNSRERGAALALNSIAIGSAVVLFPTVSSYILSLRGWSAMAVVGIGLMSMAFILTLALRETESGKWNHPEKRNTKNKAHRRIEPSSECLPPVTSKTEVKKTHGG